MGDSATQKEKFSSEEFDELGEAQGEPVEQAKGSYAKPLTQKEEAQTTEEGLGELIGEVQIELKKPPGTAVPAQQPPKSLEDTVNAGILIKVEDPRLDEYRASQTLIYVVRSITRKDLGALNKGDVGKLVIIGVDRIKHDIWYDVSPEGAFNLELPPFEIIETSQGGVWVKPAYPEHYKYPERIGQIFSKNPKGDPFTAEEQEKLPIVVKVLYYVSKENKDSFVPQPWGDIEIMYTPIPELEPSNDTYSKAPQELAQSRPSARRVAFEDESSAESLDDSVVRELQEDYKETLGILREVREAVTPEVLAKLTKKAGEAGAILEELKTADPSKRDSLRKSYETTRDKLLSMFYRLKFKS